MKRSPVTIFALLLLTPAAWSSEGEPPVAVSPGSGNGVETVAQRCPTFSWAHQGGATGYILAVYEVTEGVALEEPTIRLDLPTGASSWTVPAGRCLARGSTHVWTVGAVGDRNEPVWSEPVLFRVVTDPTGAELAEGMKEKGPSGQQGTGNDPEGDAPREIRLEKGAAGEEPIHRPAAAATTRLSVDGNVDALSFTGDGSNLVGIATAAELASHGSDGTAHHAPTVDTDTTCDGVPCDGTAFTNVTAVAGDSATGFFSTGQIEEAFIADEIARDSEISSLGGSAWSLSGNSGTEFLTHFLGTTDREPLALAVDSTPLVWMALDALPYSSSSPNTPLDIPDNAPPGVVDSIEIPGSYSESDNFWTMVTFAVQVELTNSDLSTIRIELTAPDSSLYVLYDGGSTGTYMDRRFETAVTGDLTEWVGQRPFGTWTLKVVDSGYLNNGNDGQILDWTIEYDVLTAPSVYVRGPLHADGSEITNLDAGNMSQGHVMHDLLSGEYDIDVTGTASNVTGVVAVSHGGTGATNAGDALTNLGAAAASHSHVHTDILDLPDYLDKTTGASQTIDMSSATDTMLWVTNSDASQVANLVVEGAVKATSLDVTAVRSIWWGALDLTADGSYCADPSKMTVQAAQFHAISCSDSDSATVQGLAGMPKSWDGGSVVFELQAVNTDASASGDLVVLFSAHCLGDGEVISAFGTSESARVAFTAADAVEHGATREVAPKGTCAPGDTLFWRAQVDETGTTTQMHNTLILGVRMEFQSQLGG